MAHQLLLLFSKKLTASHKINTKNVAKAIYFSLHSKMGDVYMFVMVRVKLHYEREYINQHIFTAFEIQTKFS